MTSVAVLGLGRMGAAIAARLSGHLSSNHAVSTWTRSAGGSPTDVVAGADVVLLCLYDGPACREVVTACLTALTAGTTVVNTTTVGPDEAAELEEMVTATGAAYLHSPVMGSTPAVTAGRLTLIAGGKPSTEVEAVLAPLGETLVFGSAAEAAGLKLVANGTLGDSVASLRRALARGEALGLPRDAVLDVVGRGALGRLVDGRREVLDGSGARPAATFAAGALAKDLSLLAGAADTVSDASSVVSTLLADGSLRDDDDISVVGVAAPELAWLADARLDVSPEVVADPDVLRPLHAYALTHSTGDPAHLSEAFLPTAHIEGYRAGEFVSWTLEAFRGLFSGEPADDEPTRSRRIERLDVRGSVATAVMTLHHGEVDFTDVFVLVRRPDVAWRIANKAYERRSWPGDGLWGAAS
jgi:3-hydroxyisobutyrate dehydrogenase-like beta-hydroxyacid dehydrogenase